MLRTYYFIFMFGLILHQTESVYQKLNVTAESSLHSEFTGIYERSVKFQNGHHYYAKSDGTEAYIYFNFKSQWVIGKSLTRETLKNQAIGGKDPPETGWLPLSASIHVKGINCDASDWPDVYKGRVCGDCKAVITNMKSKYITCNNYCHKLGRNCSGAWEEKSNKCSVKSTETCDHEFTYTTDAICQCGSSISKDCSCSDFINEKGFGQCKKGSSKLFGGSPLCYINMPSNCADQTESGTNKGKWISAQACKNKSEEPHSNQELKKSSTTEKMRTTKDSDLAEIMEIKSDGDGSTHQKERMGKYTKTNKKVQGYPVYKQKVKKLDEWQYLFVGPNGFWRVGPNISTYYGSGLKKTEKSTTPVGTGWEYYEDEEEKWIKDISINVTKIEMEEEDADTTEPWILSNADEIVDTAIFAAGCSGAAAVLEILFCCLCFYCIRKRRSEKKMQVLIEMEERNKDVSTNFPHVVLLPGRTLKEDCAAYAADIENLKMEFRLLVRYVERNVPPGLSYSDAMEPNNFDHHNRYKDILPFNHHKIVLSKDLGEPATNYINASKINFYGLQQDFYAAMAPKVNSIQNFWQLIIDQQIGIIVMITALKEGNKIKATQYWPDKDNANIELPNCKLKYESHTYPGTYFHRKISLDAGDGSRTVHQLQTNAWKDKTAPSRSKILLDLVYKTQELVEENPGPILVHCSAGVGRSGTFLALYKLADDYSNHNVQVLDIANTVLEMRRQRVKMVQKKEQYVYIAQCLSHYISAQEAEYQEA